MHKFTSYGAISILTVVTITSAFVTPIGVMSFFSRHRPAANTAANRAQFAATPTWAQNYTSQPDGPASSSVWVFEQGNNDGWGNNEAQYYTSDPVNVRVENGNLVLQAQKEPDGRYTSARLTSQGSLDFTYGKLDIVARLPTGQGVWPALWFWPTDDKYSGSPLSVEQQDAAWLANGEIDLVEGSAWGDNDFTGSAHAVEHYPGHGERTGKVTVSNPSTQYHTYSLEWTPQTLKYLVDGTVFHRVANSGSGFADWPYDQRYHLILNIAMGGSMSEGLVSPEMPLGIDDSGSPWQMNVRSISYYPLVNK